jgi:putative Holliday junction resolvase
MSDTPDPRGVSRTGDLLALGFDFGARRIGVAVASDAIGTARPLTSIQARDGRPQWSEIDRIAAEWKPSILVVGLPYNSDGSESEMTRRARRFGNRLGHRLTLPVEFADERFSSQEAEARLRQQRQAGDRRRRVRKENVDEMAAAIILQSWMDRERKQGIDLDDRPV